MMDFDSEEERQAWEAYRFGASASAAQLQGGKAGKTPWLVKGFLRRGALVYLAAEGGSGKTTLLYHLAETVTTGGFFLNQMPAEKGRVLVVQGDEPAADAEHKFRVMGLEQGFDIDFVEASLDLSWLEDKVSNQSYDAVLMDSATSLLEKDDQESTDPKFTRLLYGLNHLFSKHQVTGVISAHLIKPADGQIRRAVTKHDVGGKATNHAAITDIWGLWEEPRPRWKDHYSMICLGKRYCKKGTLWHLQGNEEDYSWTLREVADGLLPQQRMTVERRILEHLSSVAQPQDCEEIAKAVGTDYEVARRCCVDLFGQYQIQRHKIATGKQGRPTYLYSVEVNS